MVLMVYGSMFGFFPDFDGVFLFGCGALSCGWWVGTCSFHILGILGFDVPTSFGSSNGSQAQEHGYGK